MTQHKEGVVTWAYTLKWNDYPLKAKLVERYNLPIAVDNDVNLAALGELWFGGAQNVSNMVFITIGTGIGAGVIIDGALYRGRTKHRARSAHMCPIENSWANATRNSERLKPLLPAPASPNAPGKF